MTADKKIFVIAGPNGAGKTTFARVAQRVSEGGHEVPEPVVRRRFHAGWRNFEHIYRDLADAWPVYDNSGDVPILAAEGSRE